ncbi:MAG: DUF3011 domain-containing protein [Pseudoxanthomonas sp.]
MKSLLKGFALLIGICFGAGATAQQYDRDGYGAGGQRYRCESDGNRQRYCRMETRGGVELVRQLSSTPCIRGRNWDYDRNGVWVSHGCRAEFSTGYRYSGNGRYPAGNQGERTIRCESSDNRTRQCNIDSSGSVRLVRQLSSSPCIEGRSWGYSRNRVWVSNGCRAEFQAGGRGNGWGGGADSGNGYPDNRYGDNRYGNGNTVRCESDDNRQRRCNVPVRGRVQLLRQLSSTRCIEGRNWGWDRAGVWVDRGCRGEFLVR